MKFVVIGGTGLIGSKTVAILRQGGHEVVAASPNSGVNTITGEGLKEVLAGAQVVIDLANSPSFESSPSRRTTLLPPLPMWRSRRRETASSRSPARNERHSTKSSPAI
jgi:uncharacterized protein YbjT (DUF2867 family)